MASGTSRPGVLLEPHRALHDYLTVLLQEFPDIPLAGPDAASGSMAECQMASDADPSEEQASQTQCSSQRQQRLGQPCETAPYPPDGEHDPDYAVAVWAYPEFQAQLFKVGGLRLAVPVVNLHSVVPWCDRIRAQPDQPSWCRGLLSYQGRMIRVIDTAALVLPADRRELIADARDGYILIVGDGCWGLACHSVEEVVPLAWDEIKWRSRRGKRPWLAGTALGRMCAVLDTEGFAELIG